MNKKRQQLIDIASMLFYKNGINSIGINEILNVSGIAKKTLYNHFESKEALIMAVLEQRHNHFISWIEEKLEGVNSNKELVNCLFIALESWFLNSEPTLGDFHGCFFINSTAEFSGSNHRISIFCRKHKHQVRQVIARSMINKSPLLLDAICIIKEGVITSAYVENDTSTARKGISVLEKFV
ncbi:transcriptional regulator [Marinomonas ushuaiensis DSM 15871]|uniref:Transcriptional regulator n=1 Tax=Marinomonas ushuaiensis DSM 15871 TaxID=1122207 RepID=X7E2A5_9GAMM|nr:TetR/AcrR family transcriptional regulator [Marinomonas ushuaiensis]ETX10087.1 transcriptional regulator [Marinomonas ushuaiensis DSM 15871]